MAKLGDAWYGEVGVIEYFIRFAVLVVLTMVTGNREGSKLKRRTHTGWSEVQLEKWVVLCPNDVEYASCTITTRLTLPTLTAAYASSLCL
jgi:hypothetical protein